MKDCWDILTILQKEYINCFYCLDELGTELHHAVYTDCKRFKKELDVPENLVLMCHDCNVNKKGLIENFEFRNLVFNYKLRLGYDMFQWNENLSMIIKDNFYRMTDGEFRQKSEELRKK
jgi:hypothetical protein